MNQPEPNHIHVESLEMLPADAALAGALALVKGTSNSTSSGQLQRLAQEFGRIYFVERADTIDFSAVENITTVKKFAAIGFGLTTDHAVAISDHLTELTALHLNDNRIAAAGLRVVTELEHLTSLHVATNGVGRGVASLSELWRLSDLDISNNSLGGKKILALGEVANLERLAIDHCHVYAKNLLVLAQLPKLSTLSIVGNGIGDEGAEILSSITSLTSIDAADNDITAVGKKALESLPNLTHLNI